MNHYRLLAHTADMGIEARAASAAELYRQAALGLRAILTSRQCISTTEQVSVELRGADREELLVNWLGELLFLIETRHFLPAAIRIDELSEDRLRAQLAGETLPSGSGGLEREVKAITYHQILVEETPGGWRARVYIDL